jgi:GNAT superfamily N-acetyltransferase
MLVRFMEERDIPAMITLGSVMHREAPEYADFQFDGGKLERLAWACLSERHWCAIVAETEVNGETRVVGFLVAAAIETFFGPDRFTEDLAFYVMPGFRGTSAAIRMLTLLEAWSEMVESKRIRIGVTTGINGDVAGRFLLRMGYADGGALYSKTISPLLDKSV